MDLIKLISSKYIFCKAWIDRTYIGIEFQGGIWHVLGKAPDRTTPDDI